MSESQAIYSARTATAVTPHNSTNFGGIARALYIGGAGNAVVVLENDSAITFSNLSAGSILPVRCKRVNSTDTTATSIVALF